jgi:hypothetical protein
VSTADSQRDDELLAELEEGADRERQLVDLVRLDYDATLRALSGFVAAGNQIRAIGIAAWGVVLGLGVRGESALLVGLALLLVVLFAWGDAYHAALYRRALSRAITLEGLLDSYMDRLGVEAEDAEAVLRTCAKLETHRFGMHRHLKPLKLRDLVSARPRPIFWGIYPAVSAVTVALTVFYSI